MTPCEDLAIVRGPMEDETMDCASPPEMRHPLWRASLIGVAVSCIINLLLFHDLFGRSLNRTIWADNYDSRLIHWIVEWGYQSLWAKRAALSFWDANSFYPHAKSLAFSDSLLSLQLVYTPLRMLGVASWPALYLTLGAVVSLGCLLTAWSLAYLRRLTVMEIAFVTFASHGVLSVSNFLGHYQLFGIHLAIPCLLGALGYWWRPGWRILALTLGSGALAVACATYMAPMLATFVLAGVTVIAVRAFALHHNLFRKLAPSPRELCAHLLLVGVTAGVVYLVQLSPYVELFRSGAEIDWGEHRPYSARPWSLLVHLSSNSWWYRPWANFANTEIAYAPGFVALLLGVGGLLAALRVRGRPELRWAFHLSVAGSIVAAVALVFSWGPLTYTEPDLSLPFAWLSHLIPGLANVRAPGRFGMFLGLGSALMSVPLLVLLSRRWVGWGVLLSALLMIESIPTYESFSVRQSDTTIHRELSKIIRPRTPLIELPAAGRDPLGTVTRILAQLEGSTIHWGWLVAGYGGRSTPEFVELERLDRELQLGRGRMRDIIAFADKLGVRYLLVHGGRYRAPVAARIRKSIKHNPRLRVRARHRGSLVIEILPP